MNVKIIDVAHGTSPEGKQLTRRGLSMTREIKMGELVYKESPLVAALYPDVTGYCSNCLKKSTNVDGTFCSSECKDMAALSYGSKFVIPLSNDQTDFSAQKLVSICNEFNSITPLLTSKFLFSHTLN